MSNSVIISSDWHADLVTQGVDRHPEIRALVFESVEYAIAIRARAYIFAGDLADPDNVRSHRASALAIEVAHKLKEAEIDNFWIAGNHDVLEDGTGYTTLSSLFACSYSAAEEACIEVAERPWTWVREYENGKGLNIIALPFTASSHRYDPAEYIEEAREDVSDDYPTMIVGHLNLKGITPGSETNDMPRGREVFWPTDTIRALFPKAIVIGGHYHKRQVFDGVHIVGSQARVTHGEGENEVGFLEVKI